ncbi:transcriptional regulator [hydrocarbon metagenome]|uniref:Transcriptional regulator n=1 Tax=hydrocarbon metagenome TaxID=938273 RepID=A0A0W8FLV6_9ZZZZ
MKRKWNYPRSEATWEKEVGSPAYIAFSSFVVIICLMSKEKIPTTPAILALKAQKADFTLHTYPYEERGGTKASAQKLGVDEHCVIKTLIMEDETGKPLVILMHGDKEVSTKSLARTIGVKSVSPCNPAMAEKHTGYKVGGTSPFGIKKTLPIYMEKTIPDLPEIFINAGSRGLLAKIPTTELVRILKPIAVTVSI